MTTPKITAADVRAALLAAHPVGEYVTLFEVPEGTGGSAGRRADAVVQCMYPSRACALTGFEIKVARSDWLSELKDPSKCEAVAKYCDHWVIATIPGVVKAAELPPTWGLWELQPRGIFKRVKHPPRLESVPPSRTFLAALLRARAKPDDAERTALVDRIRKEEQASAHRQYRDRTPATSTTIEHLERQQARIDEMVAGVKEATGIDLLSYRATPAVARALKVLTSHGTQHTLSTVRGLLDDDKLRTALTELVGEA